MSETKSHLRAKTLGLKGANTEVKIPGNRRLDSKSEKIAREVERPGNEDGYKRAVSRLETQKSLEKQLCVPERDFNKAVSAAKKHVKTELTVMNLSQTKSRKVKK